MLKNAILQNTYIFFRVSSFGLLKKLLSDIFLHQEPSSQTYPCLYKIEISFIYRITKVVVMTCVTFSEINVQSMDQIIEY